MPTLDRLDALEILDSRGRPTLEVTCQLASGAVAAAQVPSGASTGSAEALELRDRDPTRFGGFGCLQAAAQVREVIGRQLNGLTVPSQESLDRALLELDGTPQKSRLGANAILGVSLAFARAHARESGVPFYRHLAGIAGTSFHHLPRPTINLFSGGKHAGSQVAVQDVLVVPLAARTVGDSLAHTAAVVEAAARLTRRKYGARALVADEGGLAPPFPSSETMLEDAVEAIRQAGFQPGIEVALAVDVASSHFFDGSAYQLDGPLLDAPSMIRTIVQWLDRYPLVSVEDGLAENDWAHWPALVQAIASRALVLGDDLLCTNPVRLERAIREKAANALLLKVNQIGTLTEAAHALQLAREARWHVTISARSGETEDHWLADLATGWAGDHLKVGSITRSERLSKYNRLLAIERETGLALAPAGPLLDRVT